MNLSTCLRILLPSNTVSLIALCVELTENAIGVAVIGTGFVTAFCSPSMLANINWSPVNERETLVTILHKDNVQTQGCSMVYMYTGYTIKHKQ